jgi:hypothetical protein
VRRLRREAVPVGAADLGRDRVDILAHRLRIRQDDLQLLDLDRPLRRQGHGDLVHAVEFGAHLARHGDVAQLALDLDDLAVLLVEAGLGLDALSLRFLAVGQGGDESPGRGEDFLPLGRDARRQPRRADLHLTAPDAHGALLERHRRPRGYYLLDAAARRIPPLVLLGQVFLGEGAVPAGKHFSVLRQAFEADRVGAHREVVEMQNRLGIGVGVQLGRRPLDLLAGGVADRDDDLVDLAAGVEVDEVAEDAGVVADGVERDAQVQHVAAVLDLFLGDWREGALGLPIEQRRPAGAGYGDAHLALPVTRRIESRQVDHLGQRPLLDLGGAFLGHGIRGVAPGDPGVGLAESGEVQPDLAGGGVAHPQQVQGRRGLGHDKLAVRVDYRKGRGALERVLLPRTLVVAGDQRAETHAVVERPLGRSQAGPRDDQLHLPLVLLGEAALRFPVVS